ncbi:MAG: PEPxxWA-CTERM sorting domain-containing protein [Azoarcus sp.]|jgi:hypothetical protein|nr:PEPxxWA-CTERM sorting domain-containing protein [Azoarcus sp.]
MKFKHAIALSAGFFVSGASFAGPIVSGFDSNTLAGHYSLDPIDIGFNINFFDKEYSQLYVTTTGAVTFDGGSVTEGLGSRRLLAPFTGSNPDAGSPVTYGIGTYDGQAAFGVNWIDMDYSGQGFDDLTLKMIYRFAHSDLHVAQNSFQLILVDRSYINPGDFDFIFNYDSIQWQNWGVHVGWGNQSDYFEIGGGLRDIDLYGAFLDGGSLALADQSYLFQVRNGVVLSPIVTSVPEPETWAMLLAGLGIVGAITRRRRQG